MADYRNLGALDPHVHMMAMALLNQSAKAGIPLTVTATYRSINDQAALYARGRSVSGRIVTNARPGYSFHNFGLAIDVVPTKLISLPDWGDDPDHRSASSLLWARVGQIGERIGFRWGGRFGKLIDRPHFEWSGGLTLAELRNGARPSPTSSIATVLQPTAERLLSTQLQTYVIGQSECQKTASAVKTAVTRSCQITLRSDASGQLLVSKDRQSLS